MHRCLNLARLGAGTVAPNPMVGAVLVHDDLIIGEGYHQQYGQAHAEVNCINQAMQNGKADLIPQSTLYVSLEPCAHFGKTPPCTDLIIACKIPRVMIGCRDPFEEVNGKGIEKLIAAGITVVLASGDLEKECMELNKRFFTFYQQQRPYVILKWAESADGKIAAPVNPPEGETCEDPVNIRMLISNDYSNRLVHKWRGEEAAIMVGTNTALADNPELTTRLWPGHSPLRLVVDMNLRLPGTLKIFDQLFPTIIFNSKKQEAQENLTYYKLAGNNLIREMLNALYEMKIQSILVEGGAKLLQAFIDEGLWDEARILRNEELSISNGLAAPRLVNGHKTNQKQISTDKIIFYKKADSGLPTPD